MPLSTRNFFLIQAIFEFCVIVVMLLFWAMNVGEYTLSFIDAASLFFLYTIYGLFFLLFPFHNPPPPQLSRHSTCSMCTIPFINVLQMAFSIPAVSYLFIGIGLFFVGVVTTMITLVLEQQMQTVSTLSMMSSSLIGRESS